jgi:hypothetical protein
MLDVEQRLRRLAADGERLATAPGPQAAIRRGRRRRRRLAAGAALLTTVVLVVVLSPAALRGPDPPAVAPALRPGLSPAQLPGQLPTYRVVQSTKGRVQIRGSWRGQSWRYILRADPSNPFAGFSDWFEFDSGAGGGGKPGSSTLMLRQCCDTRFRMLGWFVVTEQAALIRVSFERSGRPFGPFDFRPHSLRPALALGYVAYEQQPDMKIRNVELIGRSGRAICHQRFRAVTDKQRGTFEMPVRDEPGTCWN